MNTYGQLDLTNLKRIIEAHPEMIKTVKFKDGEHQLINVDVREQAEDKYGCVAQISIPCRQENKKNGLWYGIGNLKPSKFQNTAQPGPQQQQNPYRQAPRYQQQQAQQGNSSLMSDSTTYDTIPF